MAHTIEPKVRTESLTARLANLTNSDAAHSNRLFALVRFLAHSWGQIRGLAPEARCTFEEARPKLPAKTRNFRNCSHRLATAVANRNSDITHGTTPSAPPIIIRIKTYRSQKFGRSSKKLLLVAGQGLKRR
jgi:hypothetical protein